MGRPAFTQRDVEKAIAACQARGVEVGRVEIFRPGKDTPGRIVILPLGSEPGQGDDLDDELRAWRLKGDGGA